MKKPCYMIALFAFIITNIVSCKKENSTPTITNTETPMQTTIAQQLVVDTVSVFNNGNWEMGQKLYFSKNGYVNKLGCKMPNTGQFRVCFWDYNTSNIIAATIIDVTDSTKFFYNSVSPITITANMRYVVSVNNTSNSTAKDYFIYYKKTNFAFPTSIYPFTTGSVTYESRLELNTATSTFPNITTSLQDVIVGIADLEFKPIEQ